MLSYTEVRDKFDIYFSDNLNFPSEPRGLYQPCVYTLEDSGKRIRPVLAILSAQLFSSEISEDVYKTATALELFHNFTLIHDDIMDKAPLRRGKMTVHEKYDLSTAILSGDVMNIFSYKILSSIGVKHLPSILALFNTTAIEVCEGQQLDMDFESTNEVTIEDYLQMIKLKTSVLLGCSMKSGAILADASPRDADLLYQIGLNLGMAFQLQDDYLDSFGDEVQIGKSIGGDIAANKKTFLLLKALELSSSEQTLFLQNGIDSQNSKKKIDQTIALFKDLTVDKIASSLIKDYFDKTQQDLERLHVPQLRLEPVQELIHLLINRKK